MKWGLVSMPSIWPRATIAGSMPASANSENLMLDEPAFKTRIVSVIAPPSLYLIPRSKQQDHAITLDASWRRAAATSAATAQEARRAISESARLVRIIGT